MKRLVQLLLALGLLVAMAAPAFAVDLEYGGYWRTRAYAINGFSGDSDDDSGTYSGVDMRGRMWVKYLLNRDLSWTNRVEFNVKWGDEDNGGGIATDGTDYLRWKHTFVDWTTEPIDDLELNFRIGLQRVEIARGLLFSDDFAGLKVWYSGDDFIFPFIWMKAKEGHTETDFAAEDETSDRDEFDVDFIGVNPKIFYDDYTINPFFFYLTSSNEKYWTATNPDDVTPGTTERDQFYVGLDLEYAPDWGNIWMTGIYTFGTVDTTPEAETETGIDSLDINAFLLAAGVEVYLDDLGLHAQGFYSSGDDSLDSDMESFYVPAGQYYTWSEIMGGGSFDAYSAPVGTPGTAPNNVWAVNGGLSYQVSDVLKLTGDVWYAEQAEENLYQPEKDLGTEVDLTVDWAVNDDLAIKLVGAYLFAGDAIGDAHDTNAGDETDPWEVGLQLSLRFTTE